MIPAHTLLDHVMLLAAFALVHAVQVAHVEPGRAVNDDEWFPIVVRVVSSDDLSTRASNRVATMTGFAGASPFFEGPFDGGREDVFSRRPLIELHVAGEDVVVKYSASDPAGYSGHRASIQIGPGGGSASIALYGDTAPRPVSDGSGVVVVYAGEERSVVEFKLFAVEGGNEVFALVGRFSLDDVGLAGLRRLAGRRERSGTSTERQPSGLGAVGSDAKSEGDVDVLGRRQGIWTNTFGELHVVTTWSDGVLDGPATFSRDGVVYWAQVWRAGLPDGPSIICDVGGSQDSHFALGRRHGLQRVFDADGTLTYSETYTWGGRRRTPADARAAEAKALAFASEVERLARVPD